MVDATPRPPANFPASWAIDSGEDVFGRPLKSKVCVKSCVGLQRGGL